MTFAPDTRQGMGMPAVVRTLLFWVLMILLAVVLWKMASVGPAEPSVPRMTYSDFMAQVDKNNIGTAQLFDWRETAEIEGQLRQPPDKFKVTIPKEAIPGLTDRLRKQGVGITVSSLSQSDWTDYFLDSAPFLLLFAIWIFMMRKRLQTKREQSPPGEISNRPL